MGAHESAVDKTKNKERRTVMKLRTVLVSLFGASDNDPKYRPEGEVEGVLTGKKCNEPQIPTLEGSAKLIEKEDKQGKSSKRTQAAKPQCRNVHSTEGTARMRSPSTSLIGSIGSHREIPGHQTGRGKPR